MRKLIALTMVLCVASVASAAVYNHTVTVTGTVGADDDNNTTTFSIENRYVLSGPDNGTLVGADMIVVTPTGRNVYDDVMIMNIDDETGYIGLSAIVGGDDRESYHGDEWAAGSWGDYIALGTPPIEAHPDPVAGPGPAEAPPTMTSNGLLLSPRQ